MHSRIAIIFALALTTCGLSSNSFATTVMNCVFETYATNTIQDLSQLTSSSVAGIPVKNVDSGVKMARQAVKSVSISNKQFVDLAVVTGPTVLKVISADSNFKSVCAIVVGEPIGTECIDLANNAPVSPEFCRR